MINSFTLDTIDANKYDCMLKVLNQAGVNTRKLGELAKQKENYVKNKYVWSEEDLKVSFYLNPQGKLTFVETTHQDGRKDDLVEANTFFGVLLRNY